MSALKDLTGQRFGRLKVIYLIRKRRKGRVVWKCKCDCRTLIEVRSSDLLRGHTKSCGCLLREWKAKSKPNFKHGDAITGNKTRLYKAWQAMNQRCLNPSDASYKYYGRRGISICELWKHSYLAFKYWAMANGYADNLTIDRIDNDGDYTSDNCRWITKSENSKKPKHKYS